MIKRYFLLGLRALVKRKMYSFINIAGLSLALSCSLVCFAFVRFFYNADTFHENVNRVYTIQSVSSSQGEQRLNGKSPLPLGAAIKEFPQVEHVVRISRRIGLVTVNDETFEDVFTFAEPQFFDLFTFPLQQGTENSWGDPTSVMLDQKSTKKYFGNENPIGQSIITRFIDTDGNEVVQSFTVSGVAEEFPLNASFRFHILLPFDYQKQLGLQLDNWQKSCDATFVLLKSQEDIIAVNDLTQNFLATYNQLNPDLPLERFHFESLKTASLNSYLVNDDVFNGAPKFVFVILSVISFFLIVMACFNYMNIAIASTSYRLKEIGVRKVMGSNRLQLMGQFLAENLVVCAIALFTALLLAQTVFVPGFGNFFGLTFEIDYSEPILWLTLFTLLVVVAIGGAGYPAFYISSFQPVQVLKDKAKLTSKNLFRRSLLSFQFFLSYVSITTAIAFILNADFQKSKSWGYNPDDKIVVKVNQEEQFIALRNNLAQFQSVVSIAGAVESLGKGTGQVLVRLNEENLQVNAMHVGDQYIETMGLNLTKGRSFNGQLESDYLESVLVNETLAKEFGWDNSVGKVLEINSKKYNVIGEIEDIHYEPFTELIEPLVLLLVKEDQYGYLVAGTVPGQTEQINAAIRGGWKMIAPERPLVSYLQNSVFDQVFRSFDAPTKVMTSTAAITIFIAVIGLFGLTSLTMASKLRELSIRKALGGNVKALSWILNREVALLLGIACAVGIPFSYFFLQNFLLTVSQYIFPLTPNLFIGTLTILIALALATVSFHLYRLSTLSPIKHLREE